MRCKAWAVFLLTVTIGWLFIVVSTAVDFCKSGCDEPPGDTCGECELLNPEFCGQVHCDQLPTIVVKKIGQCQPATGPLLDQWLKKTWWDCSVPRDGKADCECWTWFLRLKP